MNFRDSDPSANYRRNHYLVTEREPAPFAVARRIVLPLGSLFFGEEFHDLTPRSSSNSAQRPGSAATRRSVGSNPYRACAWLRPGRFRERENLLLLVFREMQVPGQFGAVGQSHVSLANGSSGSRRISLPLVMATSQSFVAAVWEHGNAIAEAQRIQPIQRCRSCSLEQTARATK